MLTKPMAKKPLRAPERTEEIRQAIQSILETKEDRDGGTSIEVARLYYTVPFLLRLIGLLFWHTKNRFFDPQGRATDTFIERLQPT